METTLQAQIESLESKIDVLRLRGRAPTGWAWMLALAPLALLALAAVGIGLSVNFWIPIVVYWIFFLSVWSADLKTVAIWRTGRAEIWRELGFRTRLYRTLLVVFPPVFVPVYLWRRSKPAAFVAFFLYWVVLIAGIAAYEYAGIPS